MATDFLADDKVDDGFSLWKKTGAVFTVMCLSGSEDLRSGNSLARAHPHVSERPKGGVTRRGRLWKSASGSALLCRGRRATGSRRRADQTQTEHLRKRQTPTPRADQTEHLRKRQALTPAGGTGFRTETQGNLRRVRRPRRQTTRLGPGGGGWRRTARRPVVPGSARVEMSSRRRRPRQADRWSRRGGATNSPGSRPGLTISFSGEIPVIGGNGIPVNFG